MIGFVVESRAVMVVIYSGIPTEVPSQLSACGRKSRRAVSVPALGVNQALRHVGCPEVPVDSQDLTRYQKQSLAALKFRMATYLFERMVSFHTKYSLPNCAEVSSSVREALQAYADCVNNPIDCQKIPGRRRGI